MGNNKSFLQYTLCLEGMTEKSFDDHPDQTKKIQEQFEKEKGVNSPEYGCSEIGSGKDGSQLVVGRIHARTASECKAILQEYKKLLKSTFQPFGCKSVSTILAMGGRYI